MNVKFFYCTDPPEKVSKDLDVNDPQLTVTNVRFTADNSLSVREPTIEFAPSGDTTLETWRDIVNSARVNYFYIPKFTRFYKITSMTTSGSHIIISGVSDPLTSFKNDVTRSTQFVVRQQNKLTKFLPDTQLPVRNDHKYIVQTFGSDVYDPGCTNVILITAGKGGTVVNPN